MKKRFLIGLLLLAAAWHAPAQRGGTLRLCLRAEPQTFDPLRVADEASETIRYLTAGVLIRVNRLTQQLEPELAAAWKLEEGGRLITFDLRPQVRFSDGTPFSAEDVAHTVRLLADASLRSPTADSFRVTGAPLAQVHTPGRVSIRFTAPLAGLERLFDGLAILSAHATRENAPTLGPFRLKQYKAGQFVLLERNPYYWKKDAGGQALPYLDGIQLDIQANREIELLRFRRGEVHLINKLEPDYAERLSRDQPGAVRDAGVSLESEQMWFNLVPSAPIPTHKKAWFASTAFRGAVSAAINREDLCRVVFRNRASPALGPVSAANRFWFNQELAPHRYNPNGALERLRQEGFRLQDGVLEDGQGQRVEFAIITNAGNRSRERMAAMIQYDLGRIGMRVNVVPLDFPSLIERISKSLQYEACLLGLVNVDLDPNGQMNIWLSSSVNHQWNPGQKTPATSWEAEIDRLMKEQASTLDPRHRKLCFDQVQRIAREQEPFLYLANKHAVSAVGSAVVNAQVAVLHPHVFWNADQLRLSPRRQDAR